MELHLSQILSEPLDNYSDSELKAWLNNQSIYFPEHSTHEELIQIIRQNSSLGGNDQIFPLGLNEIAEYLTSLPPETVENLLLFLPIDHIISFCSTSTKFSDFCKEPGFWRSKSKKITSQEEILDTLNKALDYRIFVLADILIDKLEVDLLTNKNTSEIFQKVMKSGEIFLIMKMIDVFGYKLRDAINHFQPRTITYDRNHNIISTSGPDIYPVIGHLYESHQRDEVTEIIYLLQNIQSTDRLFWALIDFGGQSAVEYMLKLFLKDGSKRFSSIFWDLMDFLVEQNLPDQFEIYWNEYKQFLSDVERQKDWIEQKDCYPYNFTRIIGREVTSEMVESDLENYAGNHADIDMFIRIWKDYGDLLDEEQKEMIEEGWGRIYGVIMRGEIGDFLRDLIKLSAGGRFEEFRKYLEKNKDQMSLDDLEILAGSVNKEYQEVVERVIRDASLYL